MNDKLFFSSKALNTQFKINVPDFSKLDQLSYINIQKNMPFVYYNFGLALYQANKYNEAYEILLSVSENFIDLPSVLIFLFNFSYKD